jgi:stage II sporulation protein E
MRTTWFAGRAARFRKDIWEDETVVLRKSFLMRISACVIRFCLAAVLAGGEILGGYAPFGLGFVGASGAGLPGFFALLGACLGYFLAFDFAEALKYSAICILIFSVSFALYDVRIYRKAWFMPVTTGLLTALIGYVYHASGGWTLPTAACFGTEVILAACTVYFYRLAATVRSPGKSGEELKRRQVISLLILCISLLIPLARLSPLAGLSGGRIAAALGVMLAAYRGGAGVGSAMGVAAGLAMDLATGGASYYYTMLYGLAGILSGAFSRQGRLTVAVVYATGNAAAAFWAMKSGLGSAILYEGLIAAVLFLLLPERALQSTTQFFRQEQSAAPNLRRMDFAREGLEKAAGAFRELSEALRSSFGERLNDNDVATVFDRAAGRVCRKCSRWSNCWQRGYVNTFNALNDATANMEERGRAEAGDFPVHFSSRCTQFPAFLSAVNEEYAAYLCRRQYQYRLRENRAAVCRQYGELSELLESTAAEFSAELRYEPEPEHRLRQHLKSRGIEADILVFRDGRGRLRAEFNGSDLHALTKEEELKKLHALFGVSMRPPQIQEKPGEFRMVFCQEEPLMATIGIAARRKEGESVSGDAGTYFKTDDGILYVILSDGMGSGPGAASESSLAVRLLEQFLKAGVAPEPALKTLNSALALRWEEEGGFSTIDLIKIDLFSGEAGIYKYGAAPTYIRKQRQVNRITGSSLPAGLTADEAPVPDVTLVRLEAGDLAVLISDGITGGGEDQWLQDLTQRWEGERPRDLARRILEESQRLGEPKDDRTVLVLKLSKRHAQAEKQTEEAASAKHFRQSPKGEQENAVRN